MPRVIKYSNVKEAGMKINSKSVEEVVVIEICGDIDGKTAPTVQEFVLAQIQPGVKILLDMKNVPYMSSAGLRVLLVTYRQIVSSNGRIVLATLSEEIKDTMSMTGFLRFFDVYDTVADGLAALE
jgi:anti-sigma B factor antagonist